MTRVLYVDAIAGVAGDMLLDALVDAGADPGAIASAYEDCRRVADRTGSPVKTVWTAAIAAAERLP